MAYPYGPRGFPSIGNGLPGLPRRRQTSVNADINGLPAQIMIIRTDQTIKIPGWVTYARVGITGPGGRGAKRSAGAGGGGGGGFSGTNTEKVIPGSVISVRFLPRQVRAEALGYQLLANGGGDASTVTTERGLGGSGVGGAVNFRGGNGADGGGTLNRGSGGGAATRGGNGGDAVELTRGSGGPGFQSFTSGAFGGSYQNASPADVVNSPASSSFGGASIRIGGVAPAGTNSSGGDGGGGSGGIDVDGSTAPNEPGAGFAIVEFW